MGKRGPKKDPPALRIVKGTATKEDRRRVAAEQPLASADPPDDLPKHARRHWFKLAPDAIARGCLTTSDVEAFATLCTLKGELDTMIEIIERDGYVIEGRQGGTVRHPLIPTLSTQRTLITKYETAFGFTPGARADLPEPKAPDMGLEAFVQ